MAHVEDGVAECTDGLDNDADGLEDCEEAECISTLDCGGLLLDEPLLVGAGDERALILFDRAMSTDDQNTISSTLMVTDVDGPGISNNDILVGRAGSVAVYGSAVTPGFLSLAPVPTIRLGFLTGNPKYADGDFNADGRADLVAVNSTSMRRYTGTGDGTFSGAPTIVANPGPRGGIPAVVGRSVVVANSRIRVYDDRCTAAPAGFPANETFGVGSLCASVALPAGTISHVVPARLGTRSFVLTMNGTSGRLYEITLTSNPLTITQTVVQPVLRTTFTLADVVDVAWSEADSVFVFALGAAGAVTGRLMTVNGNVVTLVAALGLAPVVPYPRATPEVLSKITIGEFVAGERAVVITEEKTEALYVLPFSSAGWRRTELVVASFDSTGGDTSDERARDVVVGQFNDDALLDIAVLDSESGNVIIVRQQPPPCITFISSSSHGFITFGPSYTPTARFNRQLAREVVVANELRRPSDGFRDNEASPALCPARFIDIRGQWETMSGQGAIMIGVGRAAWVGSSYVIWVPDNLPFSAPALRPLDYWASAIWLLCIPPFIVEKSAVARFSVGGLGGVFEILGRSQTSKAGVQAAGFINERVREAVVDAEFAADDACENVVYVDLVGHSRGGAVITHALRNGFGTRSNYNFDVSTTLLDVIDPTPGDEMRPWITPGYIVGDPLITRVGNEWNSSFFGNDSSGEGGIWGIEDFVALVPGGLRER